MLAFWRRGRIAVVEFHGAIGERVRTQTLGPILEGVRRKRRFRALVLDIDSPGGSAAASQELYMQVARVAQVKPVVAFVRGLGASGGYFIACAAHRIVALPTAIVGSIGAISVHPVLQALLERLGVVMEVQKSGPHKDMLGFWRHPTPEEREKVQALVDDIFRSFLEAVARGRRMEEERLRPYATGEVFTARRAKELGLVDELGDLERALEIAGQMGRVPRRPVFLRPKRPLLARFVGAAVEEALHALTYRYGWGPWWGWGGPGGRLPWL